MQTVKFVSWEEDGAWLGYLQDYPDYWTQGETLDDLKDHLRDLYNDLTSGQIPGIRKVDELVVSRSASISFARLSSAVACLCGTARGTIGTGIRSLACLSQYRDTAKSRNLEVDPVLCTRERAVSVKG